MVSSAKFLVRGSVWTLANRISVYGFQFLAMLVLARVLCPEDFALMGIVGFIIGISQILIDAGMGAALLKKEDVTDDDYSTLNLFSVGISVSLFIIVATTSPLFEDIFKIKNLELYINVAMTTVVITSFGEVQNVILLRNLKFNILAIISVVSNLIGLGVAVILAIKGFGVWALIAQNILNHFFLVFFEVLYNRYLPKLKFSVESFKYQWNFGRNLLFSQLLSSAYQNLFSLVFPKISTLNFSGLYTQASKIQQIPISTISSVTQAVSFPVMAKIKDENEFHNVNRRYISLVNQFSFPLLIFVAIFSHEIIGVLLGAKWLEASDILSILCVSGIFTIAIYNVRNTFKTIAHTKGVLFIEVTKIVISIIGLVCFYKFGDYIILIIIVLSTFITMIFAMLYLQKVSSYTFRQQLDDFIRPVFASGMPLIPVLLVRCLVLSESYLIISMLLMFTYFVLLYGSYRLFKMESVTYMSIYINKIFKRK